MQKINKLQSLSEITSPLGVNHENFATFLDSKGIQLFSCDAQNEILLVPENALGFQALREYLDWEFAQKISTLNRLYQKSVSTETSPPESPPKAEPSPVIPKPENVNPYRKPPKFEPLKTYRETANRAITLLGQKKMTQLCEDIREGREFAMQYIERIASVYPDKKKAYKPLKDAFVAIAIESQDPDYDWDKG